MIMIELEDISLENLLEDGFIIVAEDTRETSQEKAIKHFPNFDL